MTRPFEQVASALLSLDPERIVPGLERTREALRRLGDPHVGRTRWCIIAGTNGKGSTAAFLDAICRADGRRTALYTSPHLERVTERMRFGGAEIGEEDFARLGERVLEVVAGGVPLSFFEALTVTAFLWFAEVEPEIGVLEVGLGGRWDATNVVDPALSVLTTVGLDHTEWLGNDLWSIAREKAGVVRGGGVVVSGLPDALHPVVEAAVAGGRVVRIGRDVEGSLCGGRFSYRGLGAGIDDVLLGIGGHWQRHNATLAAAAAELLGAGGEAIARGLEDARWPGRYERIPGAPAIILDGAHNEQGARALAQTLAEDRLGRVILVAACRQDKDAGAILGALWPHVWAAVLTRVPGPKARQPQELAALAPGPLPGGVVEALDAEAALEGARALASPEDTILIAGSLYLVGALRPLVRR